MTGSRNQWYKTHPPAPARRRACGLCEGALWLILVGLGAFFGGLRLDHLGTAVPDASSAVPTGTPAGTPTGTEDQALFAALKTHGLLTHGGDRRLNLPAADWALHHVEQALRQGRPLPFGDPDWEVRRRLLETLHGTAKGRHVRSQIALWNLSLGIVAVRDSRGRAEAGSQPFFAPPPTPAWTAAAPNGQSVSPLAIDLPDHLKGFARDRLVGMSDWTVFGAGDHPALTLTSSLFGPFDGPVPEIQVYGLVEPSQVPPGWTATKLCPGSPCPLMTLRPPPGAQETTLNLTVVPAARGADWPTHGVSQVARAGEALVWQPRPRSPAITTSSSSRANTSRIVEIATQDGVVLVDGLTGRTTAAAAELGLIPLVGYGVADPRGVAGVVSRGAAPTVSSQLTIDSRVQRSAATALAKMMAVPFSRDHQPDPFRAQRRAVLLVLAPETGAILAAAGWPPPPQGLNRWDADALAHLNPSTNPFLPFGWQGIDADRPPGSTAKIVTALTMIGAAGGGNPTVAAMIDGCAPLADGHFPCLGLRRDTVQYAIPPQRMNAAIQNFRRERVGDSLGKPERAPECADHLPVTTRALGLTAAVRDSLNVYFVRAAEAMDAGPARAYDRAMRRVGPDRAYPGPPALALDRTLRDLGFDSAVDLLGTARERLGSDRGAGGRSVFDAEPAQAALFALADRGRSVGQEPWTAISAIDALAQTSVGQRIAVTPLQMARVVAGVAAGYLPQPHLVATWNGELVSAPPVRPLPAGNRAALVAGLKAVPETGTAASASAFGRWSGTPAAAARCAIFGKTGTGEITGPPARNTAWFVGWAEPPVFTALAAPNPPPWSAPVAFACMVTHTIGDRRTGGSVCAPIVAEFLEQLARPAPSPAATAEDGNGESDAQG